MQKLSHQTQSFDEFTLDLTRGCLLRGQEEIKLRPKSFEVLKYLVENNGRLISKDELIQAVWVGTAVTDDSLAQCLRDVRHALRDEKQQIIKTVHGRGYIFDKEVRDHGLSPPVKSYTEETAGVQVIIEEEGTNGHSVIETPPWPAAGSVGLISAHRGTGIERLTTAIKQHRWSAVLGVLTLAVGAAAIVYFTRPGEAIESVAVMPFVNVSGDPNIEYLSDGLSDSIINSLSQLPNLRVMSLSSTLRYKGQQTDPQAVGRELNVRAVLIGRLMQQGDGLSISTELVDVHDNRRLWGGQYNRKLSDILAVREEISREISEKLRLRFTGEERKELAKRHTGNTEAYQAYLQGRYYFRRYTGEELKKSIDYFEHAIKIDPSYAPAYVGLARAYRDFSSLLPPKESRQKVEWALLKALGIDDTLAEAHTLLGSIRQDDDDWPAAEREFKRGIELNPSSLEAHRYYSDYLQAIGRNDEAMAEAKKALELDPLSPGPTTLVGQRLYDAGKYDQAIEQYQKAIEMDPNRPSVRFRLGWAYLRKGMYEEAIAEMEKARALDNSPERPGRFAFLAYAYAVSGQRVKAQQMLGELKEQSKQHYIAAINFVII